jgi:hypothetical protein
MKRTKMMMAIIAFGIIGVMMSVSTSCSKDNKQDLYGCDSSITMDTVSYSKTIKKILDNNCNTCHYTGATTQLGGGTILDDTTAIINYCDTTGGSPSLWVACTSDYKSVGSNRMPKGQTPLSDCDLAKIKNWIYQGTNFHN